MLQVGELLYTIIQKKKKKLFQLNYSFCTSERNQTLNRDILARKKNVFTDFFSGGTSDATHYVDPQTFERLNCDNRQRETRNGSVFSATGKLVRVASSL